MGVTGLESISASEQSQQEREKVSIRTRNEKTELWAEFLEDILHTVLDFYLMTRGMQQNDDNTYSLEFTEYEIKVNFK